MTVANIVQKSSLQSASVYEHEGLAVVLQKLAEDKRGALIVLTRRGVVSGIITEAGIVHALRKYAADVHTKSAQEIMSNQFWTCSPEETDSTVLKRMVENKISHLVVLSGKKFAGLVTLIDASRSRIAKVMKLAQELESKDQHDERLNALERHLRAMDLSATPVGYPAKQRVDFGTPVTPKTQLNRLAACIIIFVANENASGNYVTTNDIIRFARQYGTDQAIRNEIQFLIKAGFIERRRRNSDSRKISISLLTKAHTLIKRTASDFGASHSDAQA